MAADNLDVNNYAKATNEEAVIRSLIGLKDVIVAAGGSVSGSSQGSGRTVDANDNWTIAAVDAGAFATDGYHGAWIVIKTVTGQQLILQSYNGSYSKFWAFSVCIDGGWVYSAAADTDTLVAPPTNYHDLFGTLSPLAVTAPFENGISTMGLRWSAFARDDGSFWYVSWVLGSLTPQTFIFFDALETYAVGDADPRVYCACHSTRFSSSSGPFSDARAMFEYVASPYAGDWGDTPGLVYSVDGSVVAPAVAGTGTNRSNPHTGKQDLLPLHYGRSSTDGTVGAWKGKSSLFELSLSNHGFANLSVALDRDRAVLTPLVAKDWVQGEVLEF